jgi:hypothetical protein
MCLTICPVFCCNSTHRKLEEWLFEGSFSSGEIEYNDQIWRVAISSLESRKLAKLPNLHNSNYEALRITSLSPERRKVRRKMKVAEWVVKRSICTAIGRKYTGAFVLVLVRIRDFLLKIFVN